jgi:hypothetical protein
VLAVPRSRQALDIQLHQPLRGKADHLAQKIPVVALLHQRPQVHHRIGHRRSLVVLKLTTKPYRGLAMTTAVGK